MDVVTCPDCRRVLRYVDERRCDDGGYCFYRLPEPNAADTRYALSVRARLDTVPADPPTVAFLQSLQRTDRSFSNVFVASHALAGLALLGARPLHDPGPYLRYRFDVLQDRDRPPEQLSALEGVLAAIEACRLTRTPIDPVAGGAVLRRVRLFRQPGGGFGAGQPTLVEIADAVALLTLLGRPDEAAGATAFVAGAEEPREGLIYLEPAAALVRANLLLRHRPRAPERIRTFVLSLRHRSGGFVRSRFGGSPTLEYTHLAVETLAMLDALETLDAPSLRDLADRCP